jgi:hypothetical protein
MVDGSREIRGYAPCSPADHGQERRRLALDARAGEQEDRERYPHRRSEGDRNCRREMGERRFHIRLIGS